MRLPKGVVKGVKDDFDYEKLEIKCLQQEEEIAKLKRQINHMRYMSLPEDERRGAETVRSMMGGPIFPGKKMDIFIEEYMNERDRWHGVDEECLPF